MGTKESNSKYYRKNKEKKGAINATYYQQNKHKLQEPAARYKNAQSLAKSRKREFDLTFEQYSELILQPCHYCNGKMGKVLFAIGLDRIDNQMGYVSGNVLPCCGTCNKIRGANLTVEEAEVAITAVLRLRQETDNIVV
jgi:hypothetical protein